MIDILIDSPSIGVTGVVQVLYAFVDSDVFYGPAIEVNNIISTIVRRAI